MLLNRDKKIWVGERLDHPGSFQMPQGGIEEGEAPLNTLFREVEEETGIVPAQFCVLKESDHWHTLVWPPEVQANAWNGKFQGQTQKWFLCQLNSEQDPTNLQVDIPEFSSHKWVDINDVTSLVVPFKRDVYEAVVDEFSWYFF